MTEAIVYTTLLILAFKAITIVGDTPVNCTHAASSVPEGAETRKSRESPGQTPPAPTSSGVPLTLILRSPLGVTQMAAWPGPG